MNYFVTGATGFIGKRLVAKLLTRPDAVVHFLTRAVELPRLQELYEYWGTDATRVIPIVGDLTQPELGVAKADVEKLKGTIEHFFHLAAIYDLKASAEDQQRANVDGTRNTVRLAEEIGARHFHLVSSIASAGLFEGLFREDMFEEAENLDNPYFRTKHDSEGIVRKECKVPWRIFRPAIVVGDSRTGEMDKIDGPYYFFKLIQKMRRMFPSWMPTIGIEGGRINVVPVDFIVAAMDHIAHLENEDGNCFHLTDPTPMRVGDLLNTFARAAHAPEMAMRVNAALLGFIPRSMRKAMFALTPVRRIRNAVMKDLGLPDDILDFVNYPTRFDCRETQRALKGTGIAVPPLDSYAWRLWDYWERHLDPDLFIDQTLRGQIEGKVVLVTGGSSGIGKATVRKMAEGGAIAVTIARDAQALDETRREFEANGLRLITHAVDVANPEQCAAFVKLMTEEYGGVDILVNNAGRSIRRGIENSFDRFHDFERTMEVNYFGALRLTMGFLPGMIAKRKGHVINISSIGVLTNAPRFSAYVASKAAMDAWARCAASEFADRGIEFTTINMPLVKTPMIAPTKLYDQVPTLSPDDAADMIVEAIIHKPVRIATRLGIFGALLHSLTPKAAQIMMNTSFRMFPDSSAAAQKKPESAEQTADQIAFSQIMRGIHF
ncbi:SDR family oxidoreductase [Accumulibacter sp.]|jgi:NAD(P)-dependent dehydrogenase (short-subunit alcohol dehydrogenase family)|uniref:Male sterility domain protein n=1 Tax=Accumulibacter regalis TaxID=522306 RepID=C7RIN8_ACCRE|nr:SDR family oxidoreductase [Accumulibacter sp.]MBN8498338.1 SDR family oxidoreductase [Accumulibacter sp.]MBO3716561.1 SDR family oxidoreductase [Accumulibacter sp.]